MWKELNSNNLYQVDTDAKYGLNFTSIPEECVNVFIPFEYLQYPCVIKNEDGKELLWSIMHQAFIYVNNDTTKFLTWLDLSQKWKIYI